MDNSFLQTPIVPGMPIEHHEHRRLVVVLLILIILGIVGLVWWLNVGKKVETQSTVTSGDRASAVARIADELKQAETKITPQQKEAVAKQLTKLAAPVTKKQKDNIAAQLKAITK